MKSPEEYSSWLQLSGDCCCRQSLMVFQIQFLSTLIPAICNGLFVLSSAIAERIRARA